MEKPIFSGTLSVLPIGWKQVLKKTWQEKYCALYKASKSGIDRIEIFDNPDQDSVPRIITLENCIKIEKKSNTVFSVITKSSMYDFMATNEDFLQQWMRMMQHVAFKDFNKEETDSICQDNELYCPSGDGPNEFGVILHSTEASNRCKLEARISYLLVLTSNAIQLFKEGKTTLKEDRTLIFVWPYCYVRRYGHKDGKFTFEAGRKCESGEGMFLFEHDNQQEIFRCVSSKMKNMKKMLKECNNNSNNSINSSKSSNFIKSTETTSESVHDQLICGENQLHAAMIMEAGSRSPLPPSPTTSTTLQDIDAINLNTLTCTSHGKQTNASPDRVTKDIPKKPPRKNILVNNVEDRNNLINYETIGNYDEVEKRENAWKTLGMVDVRHSDHVNDCSTTEEVESIKSTTNVEYLHSRSIRKQIVNPVENPNNPNTAKMIYSPEIPADDNIYNTYDHLSFFGSTSKLCGTPSNGYKQVIPVQKELNSSSANSSTAIKSNDYDEVGVSTVNCIGGVSNGGEGTLEASRLADDSHLGYAVIRKAITPKEKGNALQHTVYNDNPYAIISKPKHV